MKFWLTNRWSTQLNLASAVATNGTNLAGATASTLALNNLAVNHSAKSCSISAAASKGIGFR